MAATPRDLRILLVNPAGGGTYHAFNLTMPPLGILMVAAHAERHGFTVAVDDRMVATRAEPFAPAGYDVVGIHADTARIGRALALAAAAKRAGAVVVMGGPHPTYAEEEVLASGDVDFVVRGEGEQVFVELLRALRDGRPADDVRGLTFERAGRLVRTPDQETIAELDDLALPARHLVDIDRYRGARLHGRALTNVHTSRGCPYKCSFCSSSWFDGVKWRKRSAANIVDEVELLVRAHGFGAIAFMDDLFTMDARRVEEVCEELIRRELDVWWWCFTRADTLVRNPTMVELMARSGCKQVFIGVESATEAVMADYNKRLDAEMPVRAIALARAHGIEVLASFILGGLEETRADVLRTIRYAKQLDTPTAQFAILTPFPGTELWGRVQDRIVDRDWAHYTGQRAVMDLPHLSRHELQLLCGLAYMSYYLRSWSAARGFYRFLRARRFGFEVLGRVLRHRLADGGTPRSVRA